MVIDLRDLLRYAATDQQREKIQARIDHPSNYAAARALGCSEVIVRRAIKAAERRRSISPLGREGWSPVEFTEHFDGDGNLTGSSLREQPADVHEHGGIDAGPERDGGGAYVVKGVSTYFNAAGEQRGQWVKTRLDDERRDAAMRAAAEAMAETLPRIEPVAGPTQSLADLCTVYTLTDAHIGMLAWHREGGEDWDLGIAERVITGCFEQAVASSPNAATAVLNQLGDLLHYDSLSAVTPTSGHILDADGRFTKMVEVAVRVLRRIITMMLEKHDRVHLVLAEGNHDIAGSVWLRTMFKALYENEPRITVDDSALPFYLFEFGEVMLTFHHSHLKKFEQVGAKIPAMFPAAWGRTTKRYCHTGNLHHGREQESDGITVVQHPTLAARDAYAARGAWFANRNMSSITYHARFGQVGRTTIWPEMLES